MARAHELLETLEGEHRVVPGAPPPPPDPGQLPLFQGAGPDPVVEDLRALDVDRLTPLEALNRLSELQHRARKRT